MVHGLFPGWKGLWPDPALSRLGGCVHPPLERLSKFAINGAEALVVAKQFPKSQVAINRVNESKRELGLMGTPFGNPSSTTDFLPEELARSKTEQQRFYLSSHPLLIKKANKVTGVWGNQEEKGVSHQTWKTDSSWSLQTGCGMTLGEWPASICSVFSFVKWD